MADDFERVKREVTIGQVIDHYGSKVIKKAVEPSVCCNHGDCMKLVGDGGFKCYSCSAKGSIIDLVMAREGFSGETGKGEALKLLANIGGIELTPPSGSGSGSAKKKKEKKEPAEGGRGKLLRLSLEYYQGVLENGGGEKAKKWFIDERGHTIATMVAMKVGVTDGKLCSWLKKEHSFSNSDLCKHGIGQDKDGKGNPLRSIRDFFWKKGLIVFPVLDHAGKVISLTVKDPEKDKEKKFKAQMLGGHGKPWLLNHSALGQHSDHIIIEGQNDEASFRDIDMRNVSGTCGGPGPDQVKKIANHCSGQTVYTWFDPDIGHDPRKNTGGPSHTRIVYKGLEGSNVEVRIIYRKGLNDDPDDFIQGILKEKGKAATRKVVEELKSASLSPLEWEIAQIGRIENSMDKIVVLKERKIPQAINAVTMLMEKEALIEQLAAATERSIAAVENLLESSEDLHAEIKNQFDLKRAEAKDIAEFIFKWLSTCGGGRFLKTADGNRLLFYHGNTYKIGDNSDFNGLMYKMTQLGKCEKPGQQVWYYLETLCSIHGEPVDIMNWIHTDREDDAIYMNLKSDHQKIIKIASGCDPMEIENGTNEKAVLLDSSSEIQPFRYITNPKKAEGLSALKSLLMDTTPCEGPQRYLLVCWLISTFMAGYQSDRGLFQVIGSSKLGKSKVLERSSNLIFGKNLVGSGTVPANKRLAITNPLVFEDNLEECNLKEQKVLFLLHLANCHTSPMAKKGSDTEVVFQQFAAIGMISSIESFPGSKPELVNRTFALILDEVYKLTGYNHDEVMRQILKSRNLILSSIFHLIGHDILPRLSERTEWMKYLNKKFPGHNKERCNEHISTMMIILEALLKYLPAMKDTPVDKQAIDMLDKWIEYQQEQATETEVTSNSLLQIMDGIEKEIIVKMRGAKAVKELAYTYQDEFEGGHIAFEDNEYLETFYLSETYEGIDPDNEEGYLMKCQDFQFVCTSAELYIIIQKYCSSMHNPNPFKSSNALGARIRDSKGVMEKAGWEYVSGGNGRSHWKKTGGKNYWRFKRTDRQRRV